MSNTSYSFKDNLTINNNRYLKWLDASGMTRSNIIALDTQNNLNINSAIGDIFVNCGATGGSNTYFNVNNSSSVLVASKLGVGFSTTENITSNITLVKNGYIGVNGSDGFLGIAGGMALSSTSGSRIQMYGIDNTNGNSGKLSLYAGNTTSGTINMYCGEDSLKMSINTNGSTLFTPDGTTVRCSISNSRTSFSHPIVINDTTPSTSATTGALQVHGGIGVQGNCIVEGTLSINAVTGNINFNSSQASTSYTTGAITIFGGFGISNSTPAVSVTSGGAISVAGGMAVGQNAIVGGNIVVLDSTVSTSSQTGSLVLYGGLGINNAIWSRSNNPSQIRLAPATTGVETSIAFYSTNNFSTSSTGGNSTWTIGQNVNGIGAGKLGVYTLQSGNVITVTPDGMMGVMTSTPGYTLDVNGNSRFNNAVVSNSNGQFYITNDNLIANISTNYSLSQTSVGNTFINGQVVSFNVANSEKMRLDTSGCVGINTTSPSYPLDVNGSIRAQNIVISGASSTGTSGSINANANYGMYFHTATNNPTLAHYTFADYNGNSLLYVSSNNRIGLFTTNTSYSLDINGNARVQNTSDTSDTSTGSLVVAGGLGVCKSLFVGGPTLKLPSGNTASRPSNPTKGSIRYNTETDQFEGFGAGDNWGSLGGVIDVAQTTKILAENFAGANDGNLRFITNNTERMRINSSGNIGIGTSSPSAMLSVKGEVNVESTLESSNASTGSFVVNGGLGVSKSLFVDGPTLKLPSGNTASRPANPTKGSIRYNSETDQFEGFGAGNNWGSLGGVIDVAQTTKILAENFAGANDGNLRFITNNTERMRINSSGNSGIGTSAPSSILHVNSNGTGSLQLGSNDVSGWYLQNDTTGSLYFYQGAYTNGTPIFGANSQGNFGIGINAPTYKLDVNGSANISGDLNITGTLYGSGSSSSTFAYITLTATDEAINFTTGSFLTFGGVTIQCLTDVTSSTNGGSFLTAGGAGIAKNLIVGQNITTANIKVIGEANSNTITTNFATIGSAIITNITSNSLFATHASVSNCTTTNLIASNSSFASVIITNNSVNNLVSSFNTLGNALIIGSGTMSSLLVSNTAQSIGIGTGGSLTVLGGASFSKDIYVGGILTSSSDIRLKQDIRPLTKEMSTLDLISDIRTIRYTYKNDDTNTQHIGFIAQDFQQHFPELLRDSGFYTLDYSKVTVVLMECIKELKYEIDKLKSQLNSIN